MNESGLVLGTSINSNRPGLVGSFGTCSPWSLAALVARASIRPMHPGRALGALLQIVIIYVNRVMFFRVYRGVLFRSYRIC